MTVSSYAALVKRGLGAVGSKGNKDVAQEQTRQKAERLGPSNNKKRSQSRARRVHTIVWLVAVRVSQIFKTQIINNTINCGPPCNRSEFDTVLRRVETQGTKDTGTAKKNRRQARQRKQIRAHFFLFLFHTQNLTR